MSRKQAAAAAITTRATQSIMLAPNPIPSLSPETLSRYLDGYERGYLREPAILFAAIESRDSRIMAVTEKRYKAVSRYGYDVTPAAGKEKDPRAARHEKAIRYCLDNLSATRALKRDERGGLRTLIRQMCEAVGFGWSAHDLTWRPNREGITLTATQMPLYWFEHTTGKLRFLPSDMSLYGEPLEPDQWMVTTGRGLHVATAVAYLYKRLSLHDWVIYCGRVGPGIHAKTSAQKDSPDWLSLEDAVANFGIDLKMVTADGVNINPIEMALKGALPWPDMVRLMEMAIDVLWRGGNLSTQAGPDQAGVMIQGEEMDTLEQDDAEMCSDAINEYIVGPLIRMMFGELPLAWVKIKTGARPDQKSMVDIDRALNELGFPFSAEGLAARYERELPAAGETALVPRSVAAAGAPPAAGLFPNERPQGAALSPEASRLIADQVAIAADAMDEEARRLLDEHRAQMLVEMEKAPTVEAALLVMQDFVNRIGALVPKVDLAKVDAAMETAMSVAVQEAAAEAFEEGK